ncbi:DUF7286 family protein [Haloarcula halophila]|uniref:DUF7286 family protein n=1 Tax=Haloarcula TaxID=2237 RepID=UPI0023E42966|nr:hypothetical protein [Halomicroarcula sp. DFY41]
MDDRGRIPFALLGVLLLVSSLTLAPSLTTRPPVSETTIERAVDRTTAETQTAVRDGVSTAGQRAAANPVVTPANTTAGRALNRSTPFRDALRIRVYLQVRDRLERVGYERERVTATASLPPVTNTSSLRAAKRRVEIRPAGPNGTALRATVENVTLRVRRGDNVVERRQVSPTVVVATPVLSLHEQVSTYQARLNNGLDKPGFNRRLTARLYPMAWVRGYAQYGGVPISNVVGNRHVSLAANGALLGVQRSTFGRSDPAGRRALTEATAVTGIEDVIGGSNPSVITKKVLDQASYRPPASDIGRGNANWKSPQPTESMRTGINQTADRAFRDVAGPSKLRATTAAAYRVEARLVTDTRRLRGGKPSMPASPGANWTLVDDRTTDTTTVRNASGAVSVPQGWHRLDGVARTVQVQYRRTAEWTNGSATRTTVTDRTASYRVGVALVGRHDSQSVAPANGISTAHDPSGSPLNGSNLADVESKAKQRLVTDAGGYSTIVASAATGRVSTAPVEIRADRPPGLRSWVYRDLMGLRERVRNISVTVERGKIGTFETNPPGRLLERLEARRSALENVPRTYNSTAQRARVAARIAYLDAVEKRLADQYRKRMSRRDLFDSQLQQRTGGSIRDLRRGLTARRTKVPRARPVPEGIAGPVRTRVDARPPYLTRAKLNEKQYPALNGTEHPLVTENINVFTLPYGNAASELTSMILATNDRTRLSTAATALRAANATIDNGRTTTVSGNATNGTSRNTTTVTFQPVNATVVSRRDRLQNNVRLINGYLADQMVDVVATETTASEQESRTIVADGLDRWNTTHERAAALTDGRAARHVGTVAARRQNLSRSERDWLRLRLSARLHEERNEPRIGPQSKLVNESASATRSVAETAITTAITETTKLQAEQLAKKRLGTDMLPAGLPVAPPVMPWYATTNVWWVSVRGEYGRFAVTANQGPPSAPAGMTTYARDGDAVAIDVDDDGRDERLGTADRISFAAETGVVVVVPPKPRGVGDKDGNTVERSPGWPDAGD